MPPVLQNSTTALNLEEYQMPFSLYVPDSTRGIPSVEVMSYGATIVNVGSTYHIVVTEGGDLKTFEEELKGDLLYNHTIVEHGGDYILYKSEIKDSYLEPEFHFYAVKNVDGRSYEFHDFNEEGGYAESVARFMLESINHIVPNKKAS